MIYVDARFIKRFSSSRSLSNGVSGCRSNRSSSASCLHPTSSVLQRRHLLTIYSVGSKLDRTLQAHDHCVRLHWNREPNAVCVCHCHIKELPNYFPPHKTLLILIRNLTKQAPDKMKPQQYTYDESTDITS